MTSSSDRTKMVRKLASLLRGPENIQDDLWVYTPVVLPLPYSRSATLLNRAILRVVLQRLRRKLGMHEFQLWSFVPTAAEYVGHLGESLTVYYCVDEWSQLPHVDSEKIAQLERQLCQRADVVFTTSRVLQERRRLWNPNTYLASHGVDQAHFASALSDYTPVAEDLAGAPQPIIGFVGHVDERVDVELLAYVAEQRPSWTIAVVGATSVDISPLRRRPNVRLLGRQPYDNLPGYCKAFSVGLIPYRVTERTPTINPNKLREYMSSGLPVVSTELAEAAAYREHCSVARSYEEFLGAVDAALIKDSPSSRVARSRAMQTETWEHTVDLVSRQIARVRTKKSAACGSFE